MRFKGSRSSTFSMVATLLLLCATSAAVCNSPQPRLVRAEYSQSDAVVIAHLVKVRHISPADTQDYYLYTLEVEETLRGKIPKHFVLWDENSSTRLVFQLRTGRKYLLFVDRWPQPDKDHPEEKNWWTADSCGNSGEVSRRQKTFREIERVRILKSGLITGLVEELPDQVRATVVAIRKKDGKRFESRVRKGQFWMEVPPGEYSVTVNAPGFKFAPHWLSYEDAHAAKLERGGCAQIDFVPEDSVNADRK